MKVDEFLASWYYSIINQQWLNRGTQRFAIYPPSRCYCNLLEAYPVPSEDLVSSTCWTIVETRRITPSSSTTSRYPTVCKDLQWFWDDVTKGLPPWLIGYNEPNARHFARIDEKVFGKRVGEQYTYCLRSMIE